MNTTKVARRSQPPTIRRRTRPAAPTMPPVDRAAEQPAEQGCAGSRRRRTARTGQNRIERIDANSSSLAAARCARRRRRQLLAVDHPDHPLDAGGNAAGEIAAPEFRRDDLVDDALGGDVGQRAFEAVTDLDAQMAVVLGDDQQRAVVDLLAADLPGFGDPDRVLLDGLRRPSSARSAPRSGCPCAPRILQASASARRCRRGQRAGLVDHAPRQRRHRDIGRAAGENPAQQQRKQDGSCSVHRGQIVCSSGYFDGAAGVGLKSTFGAVEISFSFSTEKFGFSL